jgi:hypothetical protein
MLKILSSISAKLYCLKPFVALFGLICLGVFILSLLNLGYLKSEVLLIPSLLGGLWSALYFILLSAFIAVPPKPESEVKFFTKIKMRLLRGIYYLLGTTFIVLTLAIIMISFKLSSVWRAEY